ncbi:MAG: molybdenum cofactor biosynthesis protein MoaE [Planctomycetia bacterium]
MNPIASMLVRKPIDGQAVLSRVACADAGANVLFLGTTRGLTDGVETRQLDYEAHQPMAEAALSRLRDEAIGRFGLSGCAIEHRLGAVPVGETSVAIATSAAHRREAFAAAEWLMERIKADVPIWKCEERPDGRRDWIHPPSMPGAAP